MERARPVESGFFPLDEELGLLSGSLTPIQQEHLVHLATVMPFGQAGKMLSSLLGVQISEATIRRMTEQAGACYEQVQTAQSHASDLGAPAALRQLVEATEKRFPIPLKQALSSDGAYVPLISGEWAEVRTLAIGDVETHITAKGTEQVKVTHLSYFSRMTDSATFETLSEVEMRRRRVRDARRSCAVTDGALWLQHFFDMHRPDALRILDFPHAAEYVSAMGELVRARGHHLPKKWLDGVLHRLKHEGPDRVLRHLSRLCQRCLSPEADKKLHYLSLRREMMHYPTFQQAGWPIGSGMVESANNVVMQMRLKGPGMRWEPLHVNPMLALRTAVCNERWDEAWQELIDEQRRQLRGKRQRRAAPRLSALVSSWFLLLMQFHPPSQKPTPPAVPLLSVPPATKSGSWRPSPHHPWKRFPVCRPTLLAKN
jgi:hypothetical protein